MNIQGLFGHITFLSEILPLISCLFFIKKIKTKGLKVFFVYSIFLATISLVSFFSHYYFNLNGLYIYLIKLYNLLEYYLFALMFYFFYNNILFKKIIIYSVIPFTFFWLYDTYNSVGSFSNLSLLVEFLSFIVFILLYFFEKINKLNTDLDSGSISFWISVALFFYFTGNFFFLIFSKSKTSDLFVKQLQIVYTFVTIAKNMILFFAMVKYEKKPSHSDFTFSIPKDLNLDTYTPKNTTP